MRIAAKADVGLRVLMVLAAEPGTRRAAPELASLVATPVNHVSKVVTELGQAGWVEVTRGRAGGALITQAGLDVSVGRVLSALDPREDVAECSGGASGDCPLLGGCRLRSALQRAREAFYAALDDVSVASLPRAGQNAALFETIGLRPGL